MEQSVNKVLTMTHHNRSIYNTHAQWAVANFRSLIIPTDHVWRERLPVFHFL